jgi:hypothetical protein
MNQIVYILKNESMPEYIKIGFTHGSVVERLKQLDRTGTPLPFEVYYAVEGTPFVHTPLDTFNCT